MILHGIEYQRPTSLNMRIMADHVTYSFLAFMKSIFHFCLGCYCGGYSQNGRSNLSSYYWCKNLVKSNSICIEVPPYDWTSVHVVHLKNSLDSDDYLQMKKNRPSVLENNMGCNERIKGDLRSDFDSQKIPHISSSLWIMGYVSEVYQRRCYDRAPLFCHV